MYQQYPPAVGLGHYGAHSQQRATTPPLNTLGSHPHRTAPTTPPMMPHFQHAPLPHAVSMPHEQHGTTYVNPQTVAMRHAPPSPTMQPFMVNPFNSRPASPTKLEASLDVPYAAHQHQQQLPSNGMERFGSVAPFRGASVHPDPSIYRDAPPRLPSQQHPSFAALPAASYAPHDASSMSQNHRGVSLAMPALMPSTVQPAAPPSSFGMMGSNASAGVADIASAAMAHYQQRLEERRQHEHKLAQEEAALAAEEALLLAQLQQTEVERRQIDDEHQSLCGGWANIFSQNQWYDETPFLDVSAEVADVHYRCQALEHHLGELRLVLEGHHTELRKYESNEQVRERQRASMRKLEECLDEMERRRHGCRMTSEAHFDAEAQRERACRGYLTEVSVRTKDLESHLMELGASVPSSTAAPQWPAPGSQPTSRAGSVMSGAHTSSSSAGLATLPLNSQRHYSGSTNASCAPVPPRGGLPQEQQPSSLPAPSSVLPFRQRIVSFRSPSDHSNSATGGTGHYASTSAAGSTTSDVDGASFTVALDEESFYSAGGTNGRSQDMDDDLGGLNGGSFAMNLCDMKRRRTDFSLTAM